jgi:NADH:ubiquinone oxidoreductase subunit 5 (subunit L)/multisubunit Na+/H+ antiporter MnhA subunit
MLFLLIIFLPLIGSFFSGLFGQFIGYKGSIIITTFNTFLTFLCSIIIFFLSIQN